MSTRETYPDCHCSKDSTDQLYLCEVMCPGCRPTDRLMRKLFSPAGEGSVSSTGQFMMFGSWPALIGPNYVTKLLASSDNERFDPYLTQLFLTTLATTKNSFGLYGLMFYIECILSRAKNENYMKSSLLLRITRKPIKLFNSAYNFLKAYLSHQKPSTKEHRHPSIVSSSSNSLKAASKDLLNFPFISGISESRSRSKKFKITSSEEFW